MIKNKWKGIVSCVLILLPSLVGLLFGDTLPDSMAMHWGANGAPDGWGSPLTVMGLLPLILLAVHLFAIWMTLKDNAKNEQSPKVLGMVYWIMPMISWYTAAILYATALGFTANLHVFILILLGATFIVVGNYLPKCKQNRTIGIKIKWTLASEENWNKTHRVAGITSVAVGVGCLLSVFLPVKFFPIVMVTTIFSNVGIPTVYSYRLYRKQLAAGTVTKEECTLSKTDKRIGGAVTCILIVVLVLCAVLCFTGNIEVAVGEASFTVDSTYRSALTVRYAEIDSLTYHAEPLSAMRISGFGSPRLSLGWFQNEALGTFLNYSYTGAPAYVLLTVDGNPLVISLKEAADTKALYDALTARMEG